MANWFDEASKAVGSGQAPRRTVLQFAGITGALLAAGLPTLALAKKNDKDDDEDTNDKGKGKGKLHHGNFPVSGSTAGGATFSGLLQLTQFTAQGGSPNQLLASGLLSGTFTDASGNTIATLHRAAFSAPVTDLDPPASCTILHLTLGPLHLNLLGLVVTIPHEIVLDITAVPGAGNLLGNLLCAVINLLNPGGTLASIIGSLTTLTNLATALNSLFTALNGL